MKWNMKNNNDNKKQRHSSLGKVRLLNKNYIKIYFSLSYKCFLETIKANESL